MCQNLFVSFLKNLFGNSPKMSPDDMVRDALRKEGDNGTKIRTVDHLAYFKTMDATQAFMEWVMANGYTISPTNHEFGVEFVRECAIAGPEFDRELSMLRSKVKSMKGDYDGWASPVAK